MTETSISGGAALILKAAADVLQEVGLQAATTRAVTDRAGVGRGLLNHYFRWPELRAMAWEAVFAEVAATEEAPQKALETWLATAFMPEARAYWRLWLEATDLAATDPAMAAALGRVQRRLLAALANSLAQGSAAGHWRCADAEATALRLTALQDGLAGLLLAGTTDLTPAQAEDHLRRAVALELG
ncbi:MAG: TetR family transcriptional regulator C-terminal domain-containing protein [Tabrizicola sp.]|nr:TetR family transcriptional regulator C-terminal domain-containing protein [Tabrizicola sp.]